MALPPFFFTETFPISFSEIEKISVVKNIWKIEFTGFK